jgi:hypothetical protein
MEHEQEITPHGHTHRPEQGASPGPRPEHSLLLAAGNAAISGLIGQVRRSELGSQGAGPLDPGIGAAIEAERGGGSALPPAVRTDMEHHFGADFSSVRVHTGGRSDQLNRSVQANAFTTGSDIFLSAGHDPGSSASRELLAHELTHVVQQGSGGGGEASVSHPHDPDEVQAAEVGRTVAAAPVAGPAVQREAEEPEEE